MAVKKFQLVLENVHNVAPQVKHFVFGTDLNEPFTFTPGQFITILLPSTEKLLRRSYSLANAPDDSGKVEFAASYVNDGRATKILFNLKPGERLNALGPAGKLILKDEPYKRLILIATGTGVTPYRSMIPSLVKRIQSDGLQVVLIQGVRNHEELIYGDEFIKTATAHENFTYSPCYSRMACPESQPFAVEGRVQQALLQLQINPETDLFYLCGNPDMIDETLALLIEHGVESANIRREKYISSN